MWLLIVVVVVNMHVNGHASEDTLRSDGGFFSHYYEKMKLSDAATGV